jgi:hypothetical protein
MMDTTLFLVWANDSDRRRFLGLCTGHSNDIEAYYEDKKGYGLDIESVVPTVITAGYGKRKKELIVQKQELERQLKELDNRIKGMK